MSNKVIQLNARKRQATSPNSGGSSREAQLERIKNSLDRINTLILEIKKLSKGQSNDY